MWLVPSPRCMCMWHVPTPSSLVPRLSRAPARKESLAGRSISDFLVVLSQHVRKTGKPIRTLVRNKSCDIKTRSEHRPIPGSWNRSIIVEAAKVSVCASASSSVARMQPEQTSILVPRLSRTKLFDRDVVRGVITEAVQAALIGYRLPTREQLLVTEQFVSGRDVFVSLPTGSGRSVCYGCLPLDGSSKKSVAGGTVCACVRAHKGRTGIRNETAYWSHDNHALSLTSFNVRSKNQETLRKRSRPDSLFGRVHVRVWDRDYTPRCCVCGMFPVPKM